MFLIQLGIAFVFQHDESRTIAFLTGFAWLYLILAAALFIGQYKQLVRYPRVAIGGEVGEQHRRCGVEP